MDRFERVIDLPSGRYSVRVGTGLFAEVSALLPGISQVIIVTDETVAPLWGCHVSEAIQAHGRSILEWVVPVGERHKSLWQAECLYDFLLSKEVDRASSALVAVGGGVIGDFTGFVASTWKRGIPWVNCPTTLLAMIDASIGGKTALNHADVKNCIGTVYQPRAVLADTQVLKSLDDEQYCAALAESVKHAVVADASFFEWQSANGPAILNRDPDTLMQFIGLNVSIKADIVQQDPFDTLGVRAKLNFGHTIGHALEALSGYQLSHGAAVALGMRSAAFLAVARGLFDVDQAQRMTEQLRRFNLPTTLSNLPNMSDLISVIRADKKCIGKHVRCVLPERIGQVSVGHEVSDGEIEQAMLRMVDTQPI